MSRNGRKLMIAGADARGGPVRSGGRSSPDSPVACRCAPPAARRRGRHSGRARAPAPAPGWAAGARPRSRSPSCAAAGTHTFGFGLRASAPQGKHHATTNLGHIRSGRRHTATRLSTEPDAE
eukprot:7155207-Prymnesium_polylepis.2